MKRHRGKPRSRASDHTIRLPAETVDTVAAKFMKMMYSTSAAVAARLCVAVMMMLMKVYRLEEAGRAPIGPAT